MDRIFSKIKETHIDYQKIKDDNIVIIQNSDEIYDINFIITVRDRLDFAKPMYDSFNKARDKNSLSITYAVVEHSDKPVHSKFCKDNKINYIWLKSEPDELFNKCLSYNMGALFSNKSKYILFHDLDCLIQSDFFIRLQENIGQKKCKAIQCFTKRRVLYCNESITRRIIGGEFNVDDLNINMPEVNLPMYIGAPGGSILVDRDLFFEVGGYDPELFQANSPEDAFFWTKIDTISKMEISDNPDIEIFHMNHPITYYSNPKEPEMKMLNNEFKNASEGERVEYMKLKAELIASYQ